MGVHQRLNQRDASLPTTGKPLFPHERSPRFLVTVDTEEAFDWDAPFTRDRHSVAHIPALTRFQAIAEAHGVRPVYLIDYPVATDAQARHFFAALVAEGKAHVGAHLHPWNTPPFEEELSTANSYGCNLDPGVERAKLAALLDAVAKVAGGTPLIFRAGRYGAGAGTMAALREAGIAIDTSLRPLFDYRRDGGPDFSRSSAEPFWMTPGQLAELPVTSVFTGRLSRAAPRLFGTDSTPSPLRGPLSRLRLLSRTALTPEGVALAEAKAGVDRALAQKLPLLVFSFHSPSVAPGNTSYVTNETEAAAFHQWWADMFDHLTARGVAPADLTDLHAEIFTGAALRQTAGQGR